MIAESFWDALEDLDGRVVDISGTIGYGRMFRGDDEFVFVDENREAFPVVLNVSRSELANLVGCEVHLYSVSQECHVVGKAEIDVLGPLIRLTITEIERVDGPMPARPLVPPRPLPRQPRQQESGIGVFR